MKKILAGAMLSLAGSSAIAFDFSPYQTIPTPADADSVAIGDVVGDGGNDIVVGLGYEYPSTSAYSIMVLEQLADGTLAPPLVTSYGGGYPGEPRMQLIDFDRDGTRDIVVGDRTGVSLLRRDTSATWTTTRISTAVVVHVLESGDVNGDGAVDLIAFGNSFAVVLYNDGNGGVGRTESFTAPSSRDMELGDVNGDGYADLVFAARASDGFAAAAVAYHNGIAGFLAPVFFSTTSDWSAEGVAIGDWNGDGLADVAVGIGANRPNSAIFTFTQDAFGNLQAPVRYASHDIPEPLVATDLDGDSRDDIVTVHAGWNSLGFYLQEQTGIFSPEQRVTLPYASWYGAQGLAIGDYNGDGCKDAAVADYNNGLVLLRGNNCFVPPPPPPSADLAAGVQMSSSVARVTVTNAGPDAAQGVSSNVTIRGKKIALRSVDSRCSVTSTGVDLINLACAFGTLANGGTDSADIGISFKPPQAASMEHRVTSVTEDPNPANNTASASASR